MKKRKCVCVRMCLSVGVVVCGVWVCGGVCGCVCCERERIMQTINAQRRKCSAVQFSIAKLK